MQDLEVFVHRIKSLEIQGAKEIALESLKFLRNYSKKKGFGKEFDSACNKLEKARPTAVVLHNCLNVLRKNKNNETIGKLISQLNGATKRIALVGGPFIKNNCVIMTHCHSGDALSLIKSVKSKNISVIATETEPKQQGIKTAKELASVGIKTTLITDAAAGFFMKDVDAVVVGADALRKEGVVNKIGSYVLAILAYQHKKPFYVVASTFKLDSRKKIEIEERNPNEVYHGLKGVKIRNPVFDITPWKFVTRIITEKGVMTPANILRLIK